MFAIELLVRMFLSNNIDGWQFSNSVLFRRGYTLVSATATRKRVRAISNPHRLPPLLLVFCRREFGTGGTGSYPKFCVFANSSP